MAAEEGVSNRDYFDTRINELARNIDSRLAGLAASIEQRFESVIRAVDKAESAMNLRLEGMNEFRDQLKDQTSTFATKSQLDQASQALMLRMDDLKLQMEALIAAQGKRLDGINSEQRGQLDALRSVSDRREGGALKTAAMIALIPTIIAIFALALTWINTPRTD